MRSCARNLCRRQVSKMALEFSDLIATLRRCHRPYSGCLGGRNSCSARAQRGRSCKGCHVWLRESWTLASHATRLASSLQLGAAPQQEASPPAESRPTRSAAPKRAIHVNMAGASIEDVSHVKGICEAATLLFRVLRKVQATTARLQGMLALGACQP